MNRYTQPDFSIFRFKVDVNNLLATLLFGLAMVFWAAPASSVELADFETDPAQAHVDQFTANAYEGTASCLACHADEGQAVLQTGHFKWAGTTERIVGAQGEVHGKQDLLNNFCIAIDTNEGRCTQCHVGYGYVDDSYDFSNPENIDCLVCHDQTETYRKGKTSGGLPDPTVNLTLVAQNVAQNGGLPTRRACINCHALAGGGDNVKHGDLSTDLIATTREFDVHMGLDGGNMLCVDCHASRRGTGGELLDHGIAGMSLHSVEEGQMKQCGDCHGEVKTIHQGTTVRSLFSRAEHDRLDCRVCHIPAIARAISTKVEWYWEDAGQDIDPIPIDPVTGRPTYDKKKGTFVWQLNVRPTLRFSNGHWQRMMVGRNDQSGDVPVMLARPMGEFNDPEAMIYPFKKMIGNQPADALDNTILVPHLFGLQNGDNPYWGVYDWDLALQDGASYTGQPYSGSYTFPDTVMLLSVNHEIGPAETALGMDTDCNDCHADGLIDWQALRWTGDPTMSGERFGDFLFACGFEGTEN